MATFWRGGGIPGARPDRTLATERRDFPEWHRGRGYFSVWAIALANRAVDSRLALLRSVLTPLLLPDYVREPHVTLHVCGFPARAVRYPDDFGQHQLRAHVEAVIDCGLCPFEIRVGSPFSFASAVCLDVDDVEHGLQRTRELWRVAGASCDTTPYVPHVTAGLYRESWQLAEVEYRLRCLAALPEIRLVVGALDFMVFESADLGGRLRTLLQIDLASGRVVAPDRDALSAMFSSAPEVVGS